MTGEEARIELVRFIDKEFGTKARAASQWGVSTAFITKVTLGQKPIPEWMLNKIGYERRIVRIMEIEK